MKCHTINCSEQRNIYGYPDIGKLYAADRARARQDELLAALQGLVGIGALVVVGAAFWLMFMGGE